MYIICTYTYMYKNVFDKKYIYKAVHEITQAGFAPINLSPDIRIPIGYRNPYVCDNSIF